MLATVNPLARFVFALAASAALVAAAPAPVTMSPVTIVDTERWDMPSAIAGRTYRISVYRPPSRPPAEGFPVLFVTDGDVFFPLATGQMLIRQHADVRPAIIVGISYTTDSVPEIVRLRTRDLTSAKPSPDDQKLLAAYGITAADSGGAELFYRFLTEELRPALASRYSVNFGDQTLFGHSFGGLFVLHVLCNHPLAFRTYVAASPSIGWADEAILRELPAFRAKLAGMNIKPHVLLLAGGNESNPDAFPIGPMPRAEVARVLAKSPLLERVAALARALRDPTTGPGLPTEVRIFPDENHVSVQPASISRAITFALALPTWGKPCGAPC